MESRESEEIIRSLQHISDQLAELNRNLAALNAKVATSADIKSLQHDCSYFFNHQWTI